MMTIILRGKHGEYQVQMHRTANGGYTASESGAGAEPDVQKHWESLNPLETFVSMIARVEAIGRKGISRWFEEIGRNPYTGEPLPSVPETKE